MRPTHDLSDRAKGSTAETRGLSSKSAKRNPRPKSPGAASFRIDDRRPEANAHEIQRAVIDNAPPALTQRMMRDMVDKSPRTVTQNKHTRSMLDGTFQTSSGLAQNVSVKVDVPALASSTPVQRLAVVQRKWDHLFNDIPKTLAGVPKAFKREALGTVIKQLISLRDKSENGRDDVHEGEDQNSTDFGLMANSFLLAVNLYGKGQIDERGLREATHELWKNSVDWDVAKALGGRAKDIAAWNALEKDTWAALGRHF